MTKQADNFDYYEYLYNRASSSNVLRNDDYNSIIKCCEKINIKLDTNEYGEITGFAMTMNMNWQFFDEYMQHLTSNNQISFCNEFEQKQATFGGPNNDNFSEIKQISLATAKKVRKYYIDTCQLKLRKVLPPDNLGTNYPNYDSIRQYTFEKLDSAILKMFKKLIIEARKAKIEIEASKTPQTKKEKKSIFRIFSKK